MSPLDVRVQVTPIVQIISERLEGPTYRGPKALLETADADHDRADIDASWWNGKRGRNPSLTFRASRLLTSQVPTRVPSTTKAGQAVHRAAGEVVAALDEVFHLDPIPHLMRQYVPERDVILRRTAENLSAAVRHLQRTDSTTYAELQQMLATLPERGLSDIVSERSNLGDVMLAIAEVQDGQRVVVPARLMSDGMLRFLAIATALLTSHDAATDRPAGDARGGRTLVLEELENGLHPTQAARVLDLLVREGRRLGVHTLATTHSPALLTALDGDQHDAVVVVDRHPDTGRSRLRPLPALPSYPTVMAKGSLGEAVTRGLLGALDEDASDYREFEALLGIG